MLQNKRNQSNKSRSENELMTTNPNEYLQIRLDACLGKIIDFHCMTLSCKFEITAIFIAIQCFDSSISFFGGRVFSQATIKKKLFLNLYKKNILGHKLDKQNAIPGNSSVLPWFIFQKLYR